MTDKLAYTIAEAAAASGVSESTLRGVINHGDLPVRYPTSRPVILREDLEAWLQSAPTERAS